ncbi:DtxR family iron (metal) dependent repressor [Ruminiclostridium sufflavum DSM 19573]|uniref:Manganese transport regulator n=1 Tax=Ruminiclostridium sufflavum DSM 19573 TaxID=1121337 RepID=A0A318XH03_9FIRM|nr:iron dependent repressor, metal binding and dimerization domain protein [Ruminiclostridium sufflavum]PYG85845.1 DtxR family iron (metal) dependent repressor [Ruminiclostridium sufflavum DSM 19573]
MDRNKDFHTVRGYQLLDQNNRLLTSAMEDYLEMIYRKNLTEKYMRINLLSEMLNVKPSSATKMVQKLSLLGFVKYEKYGIIFLTEKGKELGEFLLNRHNIIQRFLETIGINEDLLVETELIEHNISSNTLANIKLLNEFFEKTPDIIKLFEEFKKKF